MNKKNFLEKNHFYLFFIFLLWLLFFKNLLLEKEFLFLRDVGFLYFPYKKIIANLIHNGISPYWNPYVNCGEPILSNPQYMLFYPVYFLFYIFPNYYFFQFHFLIHILIGTLGFYFFIQKYIKDKTLSFISSFAYGFCGFSVSHILFQNLVLYPAILPYLLILLGKIKEKKNYTHQVLFSILLSLLIFGIEPYYFLSAIFILIFFIFREKWFIGIKKIFFIVTLTFLISSIQIIPTFFTIKSFEAKRTISEIGFHSNLTTFLNMVSGKLVPDTTSFFYFSTYLGMLFLFISLLGILNARRKEKFLSTLLLSLLILISTGGLFFKIFLKIPFINYGRFPIKFLFPLFFILSFYFSLGLKSLVEKKELKKINLLILIFLIISLTLFFITKRNGIIIETCSLLLLIVIINILKEKQNLKKFLIFFIFLFLYLFNFPRNLFLKKRTPIEKPQFLKYIKNEDLKKYRISPDFKLKITKSIWTKHFDEYYYKNELGRNFLPSIYGARQGFFLKVASFSSKDTIIMTNTLMEGKMPLNTYLNFFRHTGVKFLISPFKYNFLKEKCNYTVGDNVKVYIYDLMSPPIFHFTEVIKLERKKEIVKNLFFSNLNDRVSIFLPEERENKILKNIRFSPGKIIFLKNYINKLMFKTKSNGLSFFILKITYFPGWEVFIDGRKVKNYRVNGIFQGCIVPKGEHKIIFKYDPPCWKISKILFLAGILISLLFPILKSARQKFF